MKGYSLGKQNEFLEEIEIKYNKQGDPLIPAGTVLVEPPKIEKDSCQAVVWEDDAWKIVEDHRGSKYWMPSDEYGADGTEMKALGPLPEGARLYPPAEPTASEKWQARVRNEFSHLSSEELREILYQTQQYRFSNDDFLQGEDFSRPLCLVDGKALSVDEAKSTWLHYVGDDEVLAQEALAASVEGKNYIRTVIASYKGE